MITIVVSHEDGQSDEFDFDSSHSNISVGRRSTNDICIPNLSVSGRHARIVFNDGEAWIEDLNSTNGTYINNRLISRQMLNHKDELIIGKTRVRFENTDAGKTLDAEPQSFDDDFDSVDPFDDSLPLGTVSEAASDPIADTPTPVTDSHHTPHNLASPQSPAGSKPRVTPATAESPESMFESLADDLAERQAPDLDDIGLPGGDEDAPMTLSEKAKLALGRGSARPKLAAVNGKAGAAAAAATAGAAAVASKVARKSDDDIVENEIDDEIGTKARTASPGVGTDQKAGAVIEIKNGAKSGQVLPIDKPVTTLGRPGIQIAAIMRKPDGYFLMHIESDDSVDRPTLNDDAIGDEPMLLQSGDELNVAGINVEFNIA